MGRGPFPSADPPSPSVRVHAGSSCVCHCPVVPCVWAGRGGQGLSSGAAPWISSLVCLSVRLSVRLSLSPGVLCHRSPSRLIRPCSSRSPPVPLAPHCVSPPFRVTSHCPGAPALLPRTPAFQPTRPPTLWPPPSPAQGPQGPEDASDPRPPARPPGVDLLWFLRCSPAPGPGREEGFWRTFGEALEDLESCGQSELLRELEVRAWAPGCVCPREAARRWDCAPE